MPCRGSDNGAHRPAASAQRTDGELIAENLELRARLEEAEEALRAIREGEVDAVIVSGSKGDRVFSLSETENLHRLMVETMSEAGLAASADGLLLYANDRAAELLERGRSELLGHPLEELVAPADVARLHQLLEGSRAGTADDRIVFLSASGTEVPMHLWASHLPRQGEAMICLVGTDLTRLEADQAVLQELREHQEALKASRAEALKLLSQALVAREQAARMAQELRDSDRRKDAFLATLAHELRNPLVPIRNALEILRLQDTGMGAEAEVREMMARHLGHLVRLVDDLMDVSRITHGKIDLVKERLTLASVIDSAVEMVRPILQDGGQQLSVDLPPQPLWLEGDPTRLSQVFGNLLNNAIKYTEAGQTIRIRAQHLAHGEIKVAVADPGAGIPAEVLPHVFNMFAQGQAAKTQGGLGIGLTLVRKLIELHGGRVEALSPGRGQGSTVQVYLPLARAQGTAAVEPRRHQADRASGIDGRHILVVDDNRDAATSLARALELRGGARVQVAHDGRSVLEALAQAPPQVVILDIGLPDIDGHEVARRIRSRPEWSEVWLIAMTGLGDTAVRRRSLAVGFDHHLVKPVPFDRLDQVLAASVGRRAAVEGRLADIEAPQVATLRAPASEGLRSVDAFAASLLHDLAQPLSSAACYMMAAKTLAGQAGHVAEPLHHALASVEEQMEHARKLLELLRGVLAQPEPNESAGSTGDLHA